ncbi:hypothetical protein M422DRAFT_270059, partial [Sphaerobolus stellatus SS14]
MHILATVPPTSATPPEAHSSPMSSHSPTPVPHPTAPTSVPTSSSISTSTPAPASITLSDEPAITLMMPTPPPPTTKQAEAEPQPQPQPQSPPSRSTSPKWRVNPDTDADANSTTTSTANPTPIATTNANAQQQPTITPSQSQSTVSSSTSSSSSISTQISSTSSCNIPSPSPAAIAAACSTNTPNPLHQLTWHVNRTTNVYINGLPPHFKAEQLYALASQFGTVLSCRTFTRQLSDHPSGYGFVLFDTVDAAQKCIDILRSHHNLHPTFAKQAHKIARSPPLINITNPHPSAAAYVPELGLAHSTSYPHLGLGSSTSNSSIGMAMGIGAVGGGAMGGEEVGGDVYIEGLPMNIDVPTLRVLVAPHVIRGSRFFADTGLQPPQLVAYIQVASRRSFVGGLSLPIPSVHVLTGSRLSTLSFSLLSLDVRVLIALFVFRLDNRAAAQDVRNKLHGRSIRGYSGRLQVVFADEVMDPPSSPPQSHPKINSSSSSNPKLSAMYQDIYAAPQAPQQQDTNNVGGSGNVHNATGARRAYPNTNVNANGNGVGGGGGYQSQIQSPEGVVVGGVGGLGRMGMGGGYGISVEPLLHTLQGLGVGARYTTQPTPGTGSATVPPPLQPISATLSQLQMQLETLRPLLAAYTNSNNANATSDTTSNGTINNGINTNSH